jgi:inhibitor of KinA
VYPLDTPGGWHLLGRTDLALFDPRRDPPALLGVGDTVRFEAIS